jgi:hypothetical protein
MQPRRIRVKTISTVSPVLNRARQLRLACYDFCWISRNTYRRYGYIRKILNP